MRIIIVGVDFGIFASIAPFIEANPPIKKEPRDRETAALYLLLMPVASVLSPIRD